MDFQLMNFKLSNLGYYPLYQCDRLPINFVDGDIRCIPLKKGGTWCGERFSLLSLNREENRLSDEVKVG